MLDFIGTILWPIRWVVEAILVGWHYVLTSVGLDADAGVTWVLSIVLLTIVVRVCLIPIFVRQIKNQRRMMEVAPQLKKIQDKYKGKKDQFSREAMSRETMALYKETGTNPLSSCLPLLIQMPVFFSLYTVLHNAQLDKVGIGLLNRDLSNAFATSTLFGAPLKETFTNSDVISVKIIAGAMIVLMTASQFFTQLQLDDEEHVARDQGEPHVQAAEDAAVRAPAGLPLLRSFVPPRRHVLLADLELLDDGPAVRRHPQQPDAWLRCRSGA